MTRFLPFEFSMGDVRRSGEVIAGDLAWTPETQQRIREAFNIANIWRDSHEYPMRSIRMALGAHIRHRSLNGFTVARLKRMQAIRRKLKRMNDGDKPLGLNQLQDLGGCRAIMNTMRDVSSLTEAIKERFRHDYRGENHYIAMPKDDGYRSHHLKYAYAGKGSAQAFNGRRIEIQIRTILQHSWATAVEAIGLFRGEDLKAGAGNEEWLRLFQLMSSEFADAEGCQTVPGTPQRSERVQELQHLNETLGAVKVLDSLSHAVHWATDALAPREKPVYYLIEYDHSTRIVTVSPYFNRDFAIRGYEEAESLDNMSGLDRSNIVLVEADKMDNLTKAYPNYFGDVQLFKMQLNSIMHGEGVSEFKVALQQRTIPPPRVNPDPSWIGRRTMWSEPRRRPSKATEPKTPPKG